MKKIIWLFPGQGSQCIGMGKAFYDQFTAAREVFEEADDHLSRSLSQLIFSGKESDLKLTVNSQPGLCITSLAMVRVLRDQFPSLNPFACAGHSLGEYSALSAGGWLSMTDALDLVTFRSEVMGKACMVQPGTMVAVLGLPLSQIQEVVQEVGQGLWAANINCPGQIVLSGTVDGVQKGSICAKAKGAKRVIPLEVQGAFHSPLMQSAEEALAPRIDQAPFHSKGVSIISNSDAQMHSSADAIRLALKKQITAPVFWTASIEQVHDADIFIEIGSGSVLSGLNRKILPHTPIVTVNQPKDLEAVAAVL